MTPEGSFNTMFLFSSSELPDEHERAGKEELTNISPKVGYLPCCHLLLIIVPIEPFRNFFFFLQNRQFTKVLN